MTRFSWKISIYVLRSILPYLGFAWLILSVILFVQQASRYSDIFFNNTLPSSLIWQLTFALVPNVIVLTCPMAVLIGVIIGLSKMQGDSELVAIRAAGVGNLQIALPIVFLGIILSIFGFFINLKGVPLAAQIVGKIALQTALYKLESPIEPGVFNSEIQGLTVYVKNGNLEKGTWQNIFIYQEDKKNQQVRLITSTDGRIDTGGEDSELVLEKASVSSFSLENPSQKLISEQVKNLRFRIQTKRGELMGKLSQREVTPEEMGLNELAEFARGKTGKEKIEAQILWQRRIIFSITSLIFAVLGTALVLRFNRGGRGWGIFLALVSLVTYYLIALLGEQLARTEVISVFTASLIPIGLAVIAITWLFMSQRLFLNKSVGNVFSSISFKKTSKRQLKPRRSIFSSLSTGILDFDIISSLIRYFLLTLAFIIAIYQIFTAFELWKFAGTINHGFELLLKYLFYLIPFIYIQIAPSALMIATLATYIIKSRQNEVVTWTSAGQSIYRLLFPCFVLMMLIGAVNWGIQRTILPNANQIQDGFRAQLRNKGVMVLNTGRNWVATDTRIYSFEIDNGASDLTEHQKVKNLSIYQFSEADNKLVSVTKVEKAAWENDRIKFLGKVDKTIWNNDIPQIVTEKIETELLEKYNPFKQLPRKPNHLSDAEIFEFIQTAESESEKRIYSVALEKRKTTLFLPLVITLFTVPFALSLSRKGKIMTIAGAVGVWLIFMGVSNIFEQYGLSGALEPRLAVWSPLVIFGLIGGFLLTRIKT
jgi:lipopolysaccharide export LptBFGC system permease protein LptF